MLLWPVAVALVPFALLNAPVAVALVPFAMLNMPVAVARVPFARALKLDPNNLGALIGMAGALSASGNKPLAETKLSQIDNLLKGGPKLSPALREELDSLRTTIKASL